VSKTRDQAAAGGDGRRVCRTCGEGYEYPGHDSLATRTVCERCADIPAPVRRVLDIMRRRVDRLARQVEKLGEGGGE